MLNGAVQKFMFNQKISNVKTIIYTSALILALGCGSGAVAQNTACTTKSCPDSILLSKSTDGNYEVQKYLVKGKNTMTESFTFHFAINSSAMSSSFAGNDAVINSMMTFVAQFEKDTLMRVKSVKIKGWASPDGSELSNAKLAKARTATVMSYLMQNCPQMKNLAVESSSAVATWKDCVPMLQNATLEGGREAIAIINGNHPSPTTEQHLAKMPAVWSYLKSKVLPELRCVQIEVDYCRSSIVEQRVLIQKPAPSPSATPTVTPTPKPSTPAVQNGTAAQTAPATQNTPATQSNNAAQQPTAAQDKPVVIERDVEYLIIEDKRNGIIIEMDNANVDWE